MNKYRKIIKGFEENPNKDMLTDFKCKHNGKTGYGISGDENYWERKKLICELYNNYSVKDKPLIKWLLQEELKGFEFDIPVYTTDLCAFMIYKVMSNEDVYDLFDAKFGAGSDTQAVVDIELVFGLNRETTKTFLKSNSLRMEEGKEILETIKHYESNPNAKFKTREEYIHFFETKKIKYIMSDLESMEEENTND